jgi:hypothetical protein
MKDVWAALALPFRPPPLLLVAIFAVLAQLAVKSWLVGIPLLLILVSWFFKYCFMLLDHAAQGRPGAPVLTPEAANPVGEMRPLAYGLSIATFFLATRALGNVTDPSLASALRFAALLALPAIIAVHSITGSWAEALNPRTVALTISRLGSAYVVIVLVAVACWWLGREIVFDAGGLSLMLRSAAMMLVWMMLFSVIGGVLYARRDELGFEPEQSPERNRGRDDRERDRERDRFVDQVFAETRSGKLQNAWSSIQQRATQSADVVGEYSWIYARVARWPDARLAEQLAQELLTRLLVARRNGEALDVVQERLQANAEFRPRAGSEVIRLAELARDAGRRPLARMLLQDFDRNFPGHAAQTTARQLLEQLVR